MPDGKNSNHGKFDADGVAAFLRLHHPVATANNVCARSGISASTVDKWLRGLSAPSPGSPGNADGGLRAGFPGIRLSRGRAMAGAGGDETRTACGC